MFLFGRARARPVRKDRPPCPFYGFAMQDDLLIDTCGNQCALREGTHSPCTMSIAGDTPDWKTCPRWKMTDNEFKAFRNWTIFPAECHPEGGRSWDGVLFGKFIDAVMRKR